MRAAGRRGMEAVGRLLLLVAVLVGVVAMHTLGHAGHGDHAVNASGAGVVARSGGHGDHAGAVAPCCPAVRHAVMEPPGRVMVFSDETGGGHPLGLDPLSVCLAVLITVAVLTSPRLAALAMAAGFARVGRVLCSGAHLSVRGPPALGLLFTRVTVLRV